MADIEALEDALFHQDLARVRACPLGLLRRRDACVRRFFSDGREEMRAAPLVCAMEYALNALWDDRGKRRLWTTDGRPNAAGAQLVDTSPAFEVLDWFLNVVGDLDTPLDSVLSFSGTAITMTPLMYALTDFTFRRALEALELLGVLERLLRLGVSLEPNLANRHPYHGDIQTSPLCFALHQAAYCPFLIHMLIQAGARLAPGEVPRAVRACIEQKGADNGVVALNTLLPIYAGKLFANEGQQLEAVGIWMRYGGASLDTLDALRTLGLQLTPSVRAMLSRDQLRKADAALYKRIQRTFHAAGSLVHHQMPADIRNMIEGLASEGVPWHHGLGPP